MYPASVYGFKNVKWHLNRDPTAVQFAYDIAFYNLLAETKFPFGWLTDNKR